MEPSDIPIPTPGRTRETDLDTLGLSKIGGRRWDWRDPYHLALTVSWPSFLLAAALGLTAINLVFAGLYWLDMTGLHGARAGSFADAFFFSVETLATVGYGEMYPQTMYTHWVAVAEIYTGMALVAIMTGLLFGRFQRPRAALLYAHNAVVCQYDGQPTLMIRLANRRYTLLTDARFRLSGLVREETTEGTKLRRAVELPLVTNRYAIFALTLTIRHVLDERSPFHGFDAERFKADAVRLFLTVEANDRALRAGVTDIADYTTERVLWGMRYVDTVDADEQGRTRADLTRINEVEPDA